MTVNYAFRLADLMERLNEDQSEEVRRTRTMAYGYGCGRVDAMGSDGVLYSAWDFSMAYALATAECRAGVTVETPALTQAWALWISKGVVDEYRRRRQDADMVGR